MERLKIILDSFENALKSLEDISNEPFTIIVRDATIQRFEYTFEVMWKSVKIFFTRKRRA
ncbi:MAG TPA: nucleotidyltransferase substrate binding protein [Spirochaetota bacterium]|nr:nucleotidyltransferase substrate binding protein [Spirochaetota bacterium]